MFIVVIFKYAETTHIENVRLTQKVIVCVCVCVWRLISQSGDF